MRRVHGQSREPRLKAAGRLLVGDPRLRPGTARVRDAVCRLLGAVQAAAAHQVVTTTAMIIPGTFAGRPQGTHGGAAAASPGRGRQGAPATRAAAGQSRSRGSPPAPALGTAASPDVGTLQTRNAYKPAAAELPTECAYCTWIDVHYYIFVLFGCRMLAGSSPTATPR